MNRLFVRSKVVALFVRVVMVSLCVSTVNHVVAEDKPVAICGFSTDVRGVEMEVMRPGRYVYEKFENKWLPPADFGKYSIVYYGEKIDGAAKGKNWKDDASRASIKKYLDEGGVLIVSGDWCLRQLMGNEDRKKPDPLRSRIIHLKKLIGRLKANLHKEGKRLGYADDAGILLWIVCTTDVPASAIFKCLCSHTAAAYQQTFQNLCEWISLIRDGIRAVSA